MMEAMEVLFWGAPFPGHCVSFIIRERVHTTQGTQSLSLPQAHGYRLRPTYFISLRALSKVTYAGVRISLRSKSKKSSILAMLVMCQHLRNDRNY